MVSAIIPGELSRRVDVIGKLYIRAIRQGLSIGQYCTKLAGATLSNFRIYFLALRGVSHGNDSRRSLENGER
ncbi:hypothetical protein DFR42_12234 [Undibacterium pigrum]|uniref:Uncharacterized protein n=1 Tax=Undibacterium pigrum TaxID=401470 RepID=A0A318IK96_9BURK|nr:hypothetical protein DFR42_12234 [Undibacterium pigrum]